MSREAARAAFLSRTAFAGAPLQPLAGDASARAYFRLRQGRARAILMDAPPSKLPGGTADRTEDFAYIGRHLLRLGLSAPKIFAEDHAQGFLLLEDLGDQLFARVLAEDPAQEAPLYRLALQALLHLQKAPAPPGLPCLSLSEWAEAALTPALTDYARAPEGAAPLQPLLTAALQKAERAWPGQVLILRDFHAENLLLLPRRQGLRRAGLLDFQLGQIGAPAYDLVSLLQDARRDSAPETLRLLKAEACAAARLAPEAFDLAFAAWGAQRALRIFGVFARLARAGKPGYLALLPRVWGHLQTNLAHPALSDLSEALVPLLPAPEPAHLERLK